MKHILTICLILFPFLCMNAQNRVTIDGYSRTMSAHRYNPRYAIEHKHHTGVEEGYRGFFDVNMIVGNDGIYRDINTKGGGFSTSHGYQFSPYIYLGGGMSLQYYSFTEYTENTYSLPFYADFMVNMVDAKISPFFDLKLGYSFSDIQGVYFSPSLGVRFGLNDNLAINASVGYSLQGYGDYYDYWRDNYSNIHCLKIGVGLEF